LFFEFSLLTMLASGYLAMAGSGALDWASLLAAGAAIVLRALRLLDVFRFDLPPRWISLATLAYILFFPLDYYVISKDFLAATIHLVVFVASVKIVSAQTRRDFFFVKIIALLEMLAAALISSNPSFFLFLAVFLLSTVAALTSGEIRDASQRAAAQAPLPSEGIARRLGWFSLHLTLSVLLLSAALFFVLPRTARAALERFLPASSRVAGFAEEVTLGDSGAIRQNSTAVMHVQFDESKGAPANLKWRGNTLSEFDGVKWYNSERQARALHPAEGLLPLADDEQRRRFGARLTSQVWLHGGSDLLFLAGRPEFLRVPASVVYQSPGGALRVPVATEGMRYVLYSYFEPGPRQSFGDRNLSPRERDFHLRLPPVDPRVLQLSTRLTSPYQLDRDRAASIERHLRTAYSYSLDAGVSPSSDPLAWFLFEHRRGHCEYFASAMTVLLRAAWIPARVVTGFQSGSYNPISGWHVIRASDAHAWVEAWLPGEGWVTFDPTPSAPRPDTLSLLDRLSLYADAADIFWREWVLGYDLDRQLTLAFRVDQSRRGLRFHGLEQTWTSIQRRWSKLGDFTSHGAGTVLPVVFACVALLAGWWLFLRRGMRLRRRMRLGQASPNDAIALYRQMLAALEKRGLVKPPAATPMEFARMAGDVETAQAVQQFTAVYNHLRFGGQAGEAARLTALLDRIERLPQ
jgi:transglutaminase-like putative cysteine protease